MPHDNCPILVGVGQTVQRKPEDLTTARGPIDLMVEACQNAQNDTDTGILQHADSLRVIKFLAGAYEEPDRLLADRLDIQPAQTLTSGTGGNSPQTQINETAELLASGQSQVTVIAGCEVLGSFMSALKQGILPEWIERDGAQPSTSSVSFEGTADYEVPYEFQRPVNVYPLFETALRAHYGRGIDEHQHSVAEMFSRFTDVAKDNPVAWFREARTPDEIETVTPDNRYVGYPYTKRMNAIITVDQSAAIIMTTVAKARELGIDESKWVFLHGCADSTDHWYVTERDTLHASPAIRVNARETFTMAGCSADDVQHFDLYSCFPSAVQIACDEFGIPHDDPRGLTVTGGLPYHGGPSNSYVLHSVATMVDRLRAHPGDKGLCTAVGWYLTKHAMGLYSTEPIEGEWRRRPPEEYQREIDALPKTTVELTPSGTGTVEAYTVIHDHNGPQKGIVVGRLENGSRFLATTANTDDLLRDMTQSEYVGRTGAVAQQSGLNVIDFG